MGHFPSLSLMDSRSTLSMGFKLAKVMTLVYAVSALPHDTILPEENFLEEHPMKHYNDESNTKTDNYSNAARNAEDSSPQSELAQLRQSIKVLAKKTTKIGSKLEDRDTALKQPRASQ